MAALRPRYPVTWKAFIGAGQDDYGNDVEQWADGVTVRVYGVNFPTSSEEIAAGHNRLVVDRVMLVPPDFRCGERDRFQFSAEPDHDYEVVGVPERADRNPFGWNPGGKVNLRRVDG